MYDSFIRTIRVRPIKQHPSDACNSDRAHDVADGQTADVQRIGEEHWPKEHRPELRRDREEVQHRQPPYDATDQRPLRTRLRNALALHTLFGETSTKPPSLLDRQPTRFG